MGLKVLHAYLFRQNIFYLFLMLAVGIGIYLLADLFENLDDLLQAEVGFQIVFIFFAYKIPLIISQILPAVALLSFLIQFGLMRQNLELLALNASAISFSRLISFFLVYAMVLSVLQFAFSEFLGVWGNEKSEKIWREQVRKKEMYGKMIKDVWFREGDAYVYIARLYPHENRGEKIEIHLLDSQKSIREIVVAPKFTTQAGKWILKDALVIIPDRFQYVRKKESQYLFKTDPKSFEAIDYKGNLSLLPLHDLLYVRLSLKAAGSDVEWLETALHGRFSYALSILSLILTGLVLVRKIDNLYLLVMSGLICIFVYYGVFVFATSAGSNGILPPWLGAWFVNILFGGLAAIQLSRRQHC